MTPDSFSKHPDTPPLSQNAKQQQKEHDKQNAPGQALGSNDHNPDNVHDAAGADVSYDSSDDNENSNSTPFRSISQLTVTLSDKK